ncbi:hypothetical protein DBR17_17785 [Sphingomonas sp. HMWF008]|nr:hypothetical protein DBR17_17785 [Sphingomonas sp. HMWF008]
MRGQLLLASARTPYMRAGLSWATRDALRLDIRELDGARMLELLGDPVVTVSIGGSDGEFKPLASMLIQPVTADVLQLMIDSLAEGLPPLGVEIEETPDEAAVIMTLLREAGWRSAEDAITEVAKLRAELKTLNGPFELSRENPGGDPVLVSYATVGLLLEAHLALLVEADDHKRTRSTLDARIAALTEAGDALSDQVATAMGERDALAVERDTLKERVDELEAAAAKAATPSSKKPKPPVAPA